MIEMYLIDVVLCKVCFGSLDESAEAWGRVESIFL